MGVLSLVCPPAATDPGWGSVSSNTALIETVWVGALLSRRNERAGELAPTLPAESTTAALKLCNPDAVMAVVGVNDHDVPETRAEPAREPLRKMERRSPLARGVEREPESVGVLSLLKAPSSIGPLMLPTLSVMAVTVPVLRSSF